jgi:hypothetical protein
MSNHRERLFQRYPPSFTTIVTEEVIACAEARTATDAALARIRQLPEFNSLVDKMLWDAVNGMVHNARNWENVKAKRDILAGYLGPAKVSAAGSTAVNEAYCSVLDRYRIGKTCLGDVYGRDIAGIRRSQKEQANGCLFNDRLLELFEGEDVPANKTIRECVSARRADELFASVEVEKKAEKPIRPKRRKKQAVA